MGYNIGPTVAVKGESEYSKSLAQIKANMKLVASEAAVMSAQFGKNNSSVDSLKAKNLLLSKAMGEQKKAVSNAEQALKRMDAEGVKPTDRSYVQMKTNLNNAKAALQTTKKEIAENEAAMKKGEKGAGQYSEKLKHVAGVAGGVAVKSLKAFSVAAGAVAVAVGAAFGKLAAGIKDVAAFGDNIDKNSQRLGLSREAYQEWEFVLSQSGVDINSMQVGLKTLTNTIDDAKNGVPGAIEKFSRLGISMDTVSKLSREEIFAETIKGLQSMTDDTAKAALANDLFGRSGQEILPLLNQTAESTDALMKKAQDYGFIMSDKAVTASAEFTDSLDLLSHTSTGLKNKFIGEFLPSVTKITDGLALLFTGDTSGLDQIKEGIQGFIGNLSQLMPEVVRVGGGIVEALVTSILENLPSFISEALPPMIQSVSKLLELLVGTLVEILPEAIPAIVAATSSVLESIFKMLQENAAPISNAVVQILMMFAQFIIQNLPLIIQTGLSMIIALAQGIAESLPELIPAIVEMMLQIVDTLTNPESITQLVMAAFDIMIALAQGLLKAIPDLIAKIPQIITNLVLAFGKAAPQLWNSGKELILQLDEGIQARLAEIKMVVGAWISDNIVQPIKDKATSFINIGKDMVAGIWSGIDNKMKWMKTQISKWVSNIIRFFKDLLGIKSPSTVFAEFGALSAVGYANGLIGGVGKAMLAAGQMVSGVTQVMKDGIGDGLNEALTTASNVISRARTPVPTSGTSEGAAGRGSSSKESGSTPAPIFNIYAKDKDTAVEAADATLAAFQRARWITP